MPAARLLAFVSAVTVALAAASCLVTDPPGDLPAVPLRAPRILAASVVPPLLAPIASLDPNSSLVIPIEADPDERLEVRWFVDFDATLNPQPAEVIVVEPQAGAESEVRIVTIAIGGIDGTRCHSIMVLAAYGFAGASPYTPRPPELYDQAVWFYRPGGSNAACPTYDAGPFPEASVDSGEGGS